MGTNDLLENLGVKKKSCRKVVEIRMDGSRSLDVISCVFESKSSTNLREGSFWGARCRWFESSHPDAEMEGVRCKNLTPSLFLYLSAQKDDFATLSYISILFIVRYTNKTTLCRLHALRIAIPKSCRKVVDNMLCHFVPEWTRKVGYKIHVLSEIH